MPGVVAKRPVDARLVLEDARRSASRLDLARVFLVHRAVQAVQRERHAVTDRITGEPVQASEPRVVGDVRGVEVVLVPVDHTGIAVVVERPADVLTGDQKPAAVAQERGEGAPVVASQRAAPPAVPDHDRVAFELRQRVARTEQFLHI